jgi:DNA modification methylase
MIRILEGDVREHLAELPDDTFDCVVTSPPYYALRDYGVAGQIGLEPTLTEYLDTMVDVCRELRRALKPSGTFWLNIGDSYATGGGITQPHRDSCGGIGRKGTRGAQPYHAAGGGFQKPSSLGGALKPKDLCMVPNRLAIRLQEDGWYVRSEIIWHKPSPMPESVRDRPTSSHEKIWLLTKSERYWYDADAIKERATKAPMPMQASDAAIAAKSVGPMARGDGINYQFADPERLWAEDGMRNARNVWTIASQPYSQAHFATFPPELAERCIKAGCPAGGHVLDPFGGAGTTGMVADRLGRDATLIELNPDYVTLIKNRITEDAGMFAEFAEPACAT